MKAGTKLKVFKIRAVPMKNNESKLGGLGSDYTMSFMGKGIGFVVEDEKVDVAKFFQKCAKGIFMKCDLSYNYKEGDNTFFEVTYKVGSKKYKEKYAFVTVP